MDAATERLEGARRSRSMITSYYAAIKRGDVDIEDVIGTPPAALRNCRVFDVLRHAPRIGEARTQIILEAADVYAAKRMIHLESYEIEAILVQLRKRVP